jgi:integrase
MPKTLTEAPLTTRNARTKLPKGVHWRSIDPDTHLGYRKGIRGGRWLVRWYQGNGGYSQATLATADDAFPPNGTAILDFAQATARARRHVIQCRAEQLAKANGPALTVKGAVDAYLQVRENREKSQNEQGHLKRDARSRLTKHVLAKPIAEKALHSLDEDTLRDWRDQLPAGLANGTVRRLINDFKAALNLASRVHRKRLPLEIIRAISDGLKTDEARSAEARRQVLNDSDVRRVIAAAWDVDQAGDWDGDLVRMVLVLAATGARFSQIRRMTVSDVQIAEGRLMVPVSRKGRGEKKIERVGVRIGDDVLGALQPAINGRTGISPLLERWKHRQQPGGRWERNRRDPWRTASELDRPWALIRNEASLPQDVVIYALRHSSIVRGLRAGLPTRLVAALHDTSAAMIERHYAAYIVDAMDELAARAVVPLLSSPAQFISMKQMIGHPSTAD